MFQIEWSVTASKQRAIALEFWIEHNKSQTYSKKIFKESLRFEKLLVKNPFLGQITDFYEVRRVLILKNFSMYYKILNNLILIVAFKDNRRNPNNLEIDK